MLLIFFLMASRFKGTIGIINSLFFYSLVYLEVGTFFLGIVNFTGVLINLDIVFFF